MGPDSSSCLWVSLRRIVYLYFLYQVHYQLLTTAGTQASFVSSLQAPAFVSAVKTNFQSISTPITISVADVVTTVASYPVCYSGLGSMSKAVAFSQYGTGSIQTNKLAINCVTYCVDCTSTLGASLCSPQQIAQRSVRSYYNITATPPTIPLKTAPAGTSKFTYCTSDSCNSYVAGYCDAPAAATVETTPCT